MRLTAVLGIATISMSISACSSDPAPAPSAYTVTPLVANIAGLGATTVDSNLKNPWGVVNGPSSPLWIADNHTGLATVYSATGARQSQVVKIPGINDSTAGKPTGIVYNSDVTNFVVPGNGASTYIFAGEDGVISGWSANTGLAMRAVNRSSTSNYKGMVMSTNNNTPYLLAANFKNATVDVYDKLFAYTGGNPDPSMPAGFAPFNVANLNNKIYVTFAKQNGDDDEKGVGNGYIDIYSNDGHFQSRFASTGTLNSPWGMAIAPDNFGDNKGRLLVGNFGDGKIGIYDANDGSYKGFLKDANGKEIVIDGLWSLYTSGGVLYYTAGPNGEDNGVFGTISLK